MSPEEMRVRLAAGTVSLGPHSEAKTLDDDMFQSHESHDAPEIYCPHCFRWVGRRVFSHRDKYLCPKCQTTSYFIHWSSAKRPGYAKVTLTQLQ